ncbi:NAD(P)H-dependent oxidoreductase [Tropicimonas sp. TH_r6]|uniref:NAD(P)H-dependent oxidoreductase n=1 Tax=Tropicimonas sp. TH_r6 TaxID=3082085 RepID=UPI002953D79F|nr:NAD(P)H-dependent oxidoreductase [Tropicimonas sp. TH_r6]MDV7142898.1 NAD(P)H-dependent oxidoreductase [Tropicimonas sp. TH_r6]
MARVLLLYAHPGHRHSHVNRAMFRAAQAIEGITAVDLYARYPRFDIRIDAEQAQLLEHDILLFQYPVFWYSSPALVKEWLDLVLEHGFAYGHDGTQLAGKRMMLAVSAAGPEEAYSSSGYQNFPLRTFLAPMEQTATLCKMDFTPPYVLYHALKAPKDGALDAHVAGYVQLLEALRDDRYDFDAASARDCVTRDTLPLHAEA